MNEQPKWVSFLYRRGNLIFFGLVVAAAAVLFAVCGMQLSKYDF
jgi:hypothetical protein